MNNSLYGIITRVCILLEKPDPKHAKGSIKKQYKTKIQIFKQTARHWTWMYAQGPICLPEYEDKVNAFVDKGIEADEALEVLSKRNWNSDKIDIKLIKSVPKYKLHIIK